MSSRLWLSSVSVSPSGLIESPILKTLGIAGGGLVTVAVNGAEAATDPTMSRLNGDNNAHGIRLNNIFG